MKFFDGVAQATSTTGTGTITLGAVVATSFFTFAEQGAVTGDQVFYRLDDGGDTEIGIGTIGASAATMTRDVVLKSRIGGTSGTTKMTLSGTAQVRCTAVSLAFDGITELDFSVSLLTLQVADTANAALFGPAWVADSFGVLTYVDIAGATNLNSATAGVLKPTQTGGGLISPSALTTLSDFGLRSANAFDGTTSQANSVGAEKAAAANAYIGKTLGTASKISQGVIYPSNDSGFAGGGILTLEIQLRGKTGAAPTNFATDGVLLGTTGVFTDSTATKTIVNTGDTVTAFAHWWFYLALATGSNDQWFVAEAQAEAPGTINNMTVQSAVAAALAVPTRMRATLRVREVDAAVAGTDYTLECSRDGRTTWTAFPLTERYTSPSPGAGIRVVEAGEISVTGQPSGSSVAWRFKTLNNKNVELHDVYLHWS